MHAASAVDGKCDELVGIGVEPADISPLQELTIAGDRAQRFLQVVRGDVGKLLEFGVRARQFGRRAANCFFGRAALGHVARNLGEPAQLSLLVVQRCNHNAGPISLAVFPDSNSFVGMTSLGDGHGQVLGGLAGSGLVGWVKTREVLADHFAGRVTVNPLGTGIPALHVSLRVESQNCMVLDSIDQHSESFLAFTQQPFCFLALCDVV